VNLSLFIEIPIKYFVFKKNIDHFESNIEHTLIISGTEGGKQFYRESWKKNIIEKYYEDTRDLDRVVKFERNIALPYGEYKIFLNVQDMDSRKSIKKTKSIKLERNYKLSKSLLFIKNSEDKLMQINSFSEKQDTIWLRNQINVIDSLTSLDELGGPIFKVNYVVRYNKSFKDSGEVNISHSSFQNLYYIPIPFNDFNGGDYEIEISCFGKKETTTFKYAYKTKFYWTDDIDEVVSVMEYILSNSQYKELKAKDDRDRWKYLDGYWKGEDPSPETDYNELLDELNDRVKFSNKNFSILMDGWKSHRGRIYIIHGKPLSIDEAYQDHMGYTLQKWNYGNGKEFMFIDRTMSGNYVLYYSDRF
tara:strand:- start:78 stop:1160 length:1083 start_codon:yes stop_codon:yes gene_type:complete